MQTKQEIKKITYLNRLNSYKTKYIVHQQTKQYTVIQCNQTVLYLIIVFNGQSMCMAGANDSLEKKQMSQLYS